MVAMDSGADNGFFYTSQVMHFSSPFTVFLIYHKQDITKYQYPDPFETEADARELLQNFIDLMEQDEMLFLSIITKDNLFVGSIEVHGLKEEQPELGVWIKREFQQRGYAYEALSNVIKQVNDDYKKEWYIYEADIRNTGSLRLVEKFTYRRDDFDEFTTECKW